jgi:hypothetical protein
VLLQLAFTWQLVAPRTPHSLLSKHVVIPPEQKQSYCGVELAWHAAAGAPDVHEIPLPKNPELQEQLKAPGMLVHLAFGEHMCVRFPHSSASARRRVSKRERAHVSCAVLQASMSKAQSNVTCRRTCILNHECVPTVVVNIS